MPHAERWAWPARCRRALCGYLACAARRALSATRQMQGEDVLTLLDTLRVSHRLAQRALSATSQMPGGPVRTPKRGPPGAGRRCADTELVPKAER